MIKFLLVNEITKYKACCKTTSDNKGKTELEVQKEISFSEEKEEKEKGKSDFCIKLY